MCPTQVTLLVFLHVLEKRNLGYSVLNSAKVMDIRNTTIEENFLIIRIGDKLKLLVLSFMWEK